MARYEDLTVTNLNVKGNCAIAGTLDKIAFDRENFTANVAVNTDKFTINATNGNTAIAGTLGVTGNVAVNTDKLTVAAASGNTAIAGTLGVTGNVAVNTNKLTIAAASGNTAVAGTLDVAGKVTLADLLELQQSTVANLPAAAAGNLGCVVYCSNGDTGDPCLAVSNGSAWLRVALGIAVSAT